MAGLVLKLREGERVLVNGAVIESTGRGCRLRVLTPGTSILRMRDAIDPAQADTPVGRVGHVVQMVVAGDMTLEDALPQVTPALDALHDAFVDASDRALVRTVGEELAAGRPYPALRAVQDLRAREGALLARAAG
ncbi:flagellar biosynthesis repressor FlbT [Jannaschia sp. LMIT008]|uniref:flagellar biosynthesis repressor FlbT n=1 Tax=Jannaschia maritima TaxID=3032585 RepID=UPI002811A4EB|nr:flagellar biosynthesis repressor FlbT [Jannaschia sp. LMIT008]